jgi:hypothetical protein
MKKLKITLPFTHPHGQNHNTRMSYQEDEVRQVETNQE